MWKWILKKIRGMPYICITVPRPETKEEALKGILEHAIKSSQKQK